MKCKWKFAALFVAAAMAAGSAAGQQNNNDRYLIQTPQAQNSAYRAVSANNSATAGYAPVTQAAVDSSASGLSLSDINCGASCDSGYGMFSGRRRLFGDILKRSECGFDCFVSPITNPVYFEDPRLTTEARAIFLQHRAPIAVGGGDVQLYAVQLRARLSENVALIATKDGYITSSNPVIQDGWADTNLGLKFSLFRDIERQRMVSAGFTFEFASGEASALQGNGSGNLNLFISSGRRLFNSFNWLSTSGFRAPMDTVDESTVAYSSHHFSKNLGPRTWVLTEFNIQNWTGSGQGGINGIEGGDLFNFGSTGVSGNTIITNAVGMKFRPRQNSEIGVAFEYPLTERRDIIDNRINVNWIVRY